MQSLDYFVISSVGDGFVYIRPIDYPKIEALFGKPVTQIKDEYDHHIGPDYYQFPTSMFLYRLKEHECPYELVGMTGEQCKVTHLHCLRKKEISNNID